MNLFVNSIIEWFDRNENINNEEVKRLPIVERILYNDAKFVVSINIFTKSGMPIIRRFNELLGCFLNRDFWVLENDPFGNFLVPEDLISEKSKKHRDDAWELIQPIVEEQGISIFTSQFRGRLISDISKKRKKEKKTIYRHLLNYWKRGLTKNALLPDFRNCGGRGKTREGKSANEIKLGKPSSLSSSDGINRGVRITYAMKKHFHRGLKKYYENKNKRSLEQAYHLTLEEFFKVGYEFKGDIRVPIMPAAETLPSLRQFRYYYETEYRDPVRETKSRQGEINFQLQYRSLFGNSTEMAFGPGSLYQIDATLVDLYLVSSFDRTKIIGRPVLYLVVDVFSRMITGMAVLLEGPSWLGAMLALDNVVANKVEFCAEYGIQIEQDQWDCHHLPEAILADRGEFESYNADNLAHSLNIIIHNTPPYRADLKAIVERQFRILNEKFIHFEPGAVVKPRDRTEKGYELDATLTINDFRTLMIAHILDHNHRRFLKSYRKDEFMIADNLERFPISLWNWGIQNRTGHLRTLPCDVVRMNLLPRREVTVTAQGLHFERELYYSCDPLFQNGLMMRKQGRKSPKVTIAYDPRNLDYVYLPSSDNRTTIDCPLIPAAKTFIGRDLYEAQAYFNRETKNLELAQTEIIRAKALFNAINNHIIEQATEKTKEALANAPELSNNQRQKGIRENRQLEKEFERTQNTWTSKDFDIDALPIENGYSDEESEEYIAPLSSAGKIREIREQIKGGQE